jgi:methionyl-tRNA synthetase
VDAFRYFLMRDMTLGRDADFSAEALRYRYQGDLANDLGNLLHRLVHMIERYSDGRIPAPGEPEAEDRDLRQRCLNLVPEVFGLVEALALNEALVRTMEVVGQINGYLERTAPWKQAKAGRAERVATILYYAAEALRLTAVLLQPVLPERMAELWHRLGWQSPASLRGGLGWGKLQAGTHVVAGLPLFPRREQPGT